MFRYALSLLKITHFSSFPCHPRQEPKNTQKTIIQEKGKVNPPTRWVSRVGSVSQILSLKAQFLSLQAETTQTVPMGASDVQGGEEVNVFGEWFVICWVLCCALHVKDLIKLLPRQPPV